MRFVRYIAEKCARLVSKRDGNEKLPFQLLVESEADRESGHFLGAVWLLLRMHPEAVLDMNPL